MVRESSLAFYDAFPELFMPLGVVCAGSKPLPDLLNPA